MTITSEFHKAWLLHRRPYKERSVLADFLVEDVGRVSAVVRGVRQSRSGSASVLQPFHCLLVRWRGRGELKTLVDLELQQLTMLTGKRLYCGFYINELLMRAMIPGQPVDGVTNLYCAALNHLKCDTPIEPLLRSFELDLLEICGYAPPLHSDANSGQPLQAGAMYRYIPEHGLVAAPAHISRAEQAHCYSGELLQALSARDFSNKAYYPQFKRLSRQAMQPLIGDRPLKSRMLFANIGVR